MSGLREWKRAGGTDLRLNMEPFENEVLVAFVIPAAALRLSKNLCPEWHIRAVTGRGLFGIGQADFAGLGGVADGAGNGFRF